MFTVKDAVTAAQQAQINYVLAVNNQVWKDKRQQKVLAKYVGAESREEAVRPK